ncbi:hypothetical protein ACRYCC_13230 [Actinomadura scrupuli]|uniref:hypothetical protein n=1 Tax=Actinomadura scrupuli TaxID=559629 RepID=UPI003D97E351
MIRPYRARTDGGVLALHHWSPGGKDLPDGLHHDRPRTPDGRPVADVPGADEVREDLAALLASIGSRAEVGDDVVYDTRSAVRAYAGVTFAHGLQHWAMGNAAVHPASRPGAFITFVTGMWPNAEVFTEPLLSPDEWATIQQLAHGTVSLVRSLGGLLPSPQIRLDTSPVPAMLRVLDAAQGGALTPDECIRRLDQVVARARLVEERYRLVIDEMMDSHGAEVRVYVSDRLVHLGQRLYQHLTRGRVPTLREVVDEVLLEHPGPFHAFAPEPVQGSPHTAPTLIEAARTADLERDALSGPVIRVDAPSGAELPTGFDELQQSLPFRVLTMHPFPRILGLETATGLLTAQPDDLQVRVTEPDLSDTRVPFGRLLREIYAR